MAELNVARKTIGDLFSEIRGQKFIIPEYQRPYAWDFEKCETLWKDLTSFFDDTKGDEYDKREYFLGTIVVCKQKDNEIEVVDGQQRITSLFLLLRSFYKKLEGMDENDKEVRHLKSRIAPCLWDTNKRSGDTEITKPHIESKVATDKERETLHQIMESGDAQEDKNDLYTENYKRFVEWNDNYAKVEPMSWKDLIVTILDKCIVLPIKCENFELALTIFSTLNDRGLPLSDSDVFKHKIYTNTKDSEQDAFIEQWKSLNESVENADINMDDLFRYYSHIIRARNKVREKEVALRKFYSNNNYDALTDKKLMEHLISLCEFWVAFERFDDNVNGKEIPFQARKYLHCLSWYPNDYWKHMTSVFYHCNKDKENFPEMLTIFLKKITAFLVSKFIERPTVNAITDDTYNAYINIHEGNDISFSHNIKENDIQNDRIRSPKLKRCLIILHAYLDPNQKELIDSEWQIEHIFPKKWQNKNYNGWNEEDAKKYLENFGNKVAIEKKLNIQAGNGYFGRKKDEYKKSKISKVREIGEYSKNDWTQEDIERRDKKFSEDIVNFFNENLTQSEVE